MTLVIQRKRKKRLARHVRRWADWKPTQEKKKKKKKKKIRLEKEKEKISYIRRTLLTWHLGKLVGVFSKSAAYLNQDSDKDALQK